MNNYASALPPPYFFGSGSIPTDSASPYHDNIPGGAMSGLGGNSYGGNYSGGTGNWMHSDGHKANMLNAKFVEAGIGFTIDDGIGYWSLFLIY